MPQECRRKVGQAAIEERVDITQKDQRRVFMSQKKKGKLQTSSSVTLAKKTPRKEKVGEEKVRKGQGAGGCRIGTAPLANDSLHPQGQKN